MILFPRPATTVDLDRGPLKVALRKPPEVFRPSHRTAREATTEAGTTPEPSGCGNASAGLLGALLVFGRIGKRRARVKAYEARHADQSLRMVGEWCGVSYKTVERCREERLSTVTNVTPDADPPVTTGRDGKKYPAKQPRKQSSVAVFDDFVESIVKQNEGSRYQPGVGL